MRRANPQSKYEAKGSSDGQGASAGDDDGRPLNTEASQVRRACRVFVWISAVVMSALFGMAVGNIAPLAARQPLLEFRQFVLEAPPPPQRDSLVTSRASPEALERWLSNFTAANPAFQAFCEEQLHNKRAVWGKQGSQFGQDAFMFFNLFAAKVLRGERGFYVDSGANDWAYLSNSLFYDKCLGWAGLCVEPMPMYHAGLKENRSCRLLPECISATKGYSTMRVSGDSSQVLGAGAKGLQVYCRPLSEMLQEMGVDHVDFWSLDVEGFEMTVLQGGPPFEAIDVILLENYWISTRTSDRFLTEKGYAKVSQMGIDGLFVRVAGPAMWRPNNWDELWAAEERNRVKHRNESILAKDY